VNVTADQVQRQHRFAARHPDVYFCEPWHTPGWRVAVLDDGDGLREVAAPDLEHLMDKLDAEFGEDSNHDEHAGGDVLAGPWRPAGVP
jgi:hypothetical protein